MLGDGLGEGGVPGGAVGEIGEPQVEGGHAGPLGAGEALDAGPVGADAHHARRVLRVRGGVEQRLQQRARPRHEHHDPRGHRKLDPVGRRQARLLGGGRGTPPA